MGNLICVLGTVFDFFLFFFLIFRDKKHSRASKWRVEYLNIKDDRRSRALPCQEEAGLHTLSQKVTGSQL